MPAIAAILDAMRSRLAVIAIVLGAAAAALSAERPHLLVVCAPGYPGTTDGADATMEQLASALATAAGWPPGRLRAEYHPTERDGVARLSGDAASLALVPLPFFLEHGSSLDLVPRLVAVRNGTGAQRWTLVAPQGRVRTAADLAGFEIVSIAGYSPRFVREVALGSWGAIPDAATIRFSGRLLPEIRRAGSGEKVALLLDEGQTNALSSLPSASGLEEVARSEPLIEALFCVRSGRVSETDAARLSDAMRSLHAEGEGAEVLAVMRVERFAELDADDLVAARRAFAAAPAR